MPENAIAILLRAGTGRILLALPHAPQPAGWELPWLKFSQEQPLPTAQRQLCLVYQLAFPLELHGCSKVTLGIAGQPQQVQLLRGSTPDEVSLNYEHRWIEPRRVAEFTLGPLISQLWQQHALDDI